MKDKISSHILQIRFPDTCALIIFQLFFNFFKEAMLGIGFKDEGGLPPRSSLSKDESPENQQLWYFKPWQDHYPSQGIIPLTGQSWQFTSPRVFTLWFPGSPWIPPFSWRKGSGKGWALQLRKPRVFWECFAQVSRNPGWSCFVHCNCLCDQCQLSQSTEPVWERLGAGGDSQRVEVCFFGWPKAFFFQAGHRAVLFFSLSIFWCLQVTYIIIYLFLKAMLFFWPS